MPKGQILLSDQGWDVQKVANALLVGGATVERIRRRAVRKGIELALVDGLNARQEARSVAIICSDSAADERSYEEGSIIFKDLRC